MEKNAKHGVYTIDKSCLNCKFAAFDNEAEDSHGSCTSMLPKVVADWISQKEQSFVPEIDWFQIMEIERRRPKTNCDTWQPSGPNH